MNPFEDIAEEEEFAFNNQITVWLEANGRKKNTYISGWNITDEQLKEHLKTIKKKNGCNGSIKELLVNDIPTKVLQLQGDHIDYVSDFLQSQGVDKANIHIKG